MKKICFLFLMSLSFIFGNPNVDATLEVVKKFDNLPNILVQYSGYEYT